MTPGAFGGVAGAGAGLSWTLSAADAGSTAACTALISTPPAAAADNATAATPRVAWDSPLLPACARALAALGGVAAAAAAARGAPSLAISLTAVAHVVVIAPRGGPRLPKALNASISGVPCTVNYVAPSGAFASLTTPPLSALCPALGKPDADNCGYGQLVLSAGPNLAANLAAASAAAAAGSATAAPSGALPFALPAAYPPLLVGEDWAGTLAAAGVSLAALPGGGAVALDAATEGVSEGVGFHVLKACSDPRYAPVDVCAAAAAEYSFATALPPGAICAWGSGDTCQPCPVGAACPGGATLLPLPGYWAPSTAATPASLKACAAPDATLRCPGWKAFAAAATFGCGFPYRGPICSACLPAHYQSGGACLPCPSIGGDATWALVQPMLLFAVGLAGASALLVAVARASLECEYTEAAEAVGGLALWLWTASQSAASTFRVTQSLAPAALAPIYAAFTSVQFRGVTLPPSCYAQLPWVGVWGAAAGVGLLAAISAGALGVVACRAAAEARAAASAARKRRQMLREGGAPAENDAVASAAAAALAAETAARALAAIAAPPPPTAAERERALAEADAAAAAAEAAPPPTPAEALRAAARVGAATAAAAAARARARAIVLSVQAARAARAASRQLTPQTVLRMVGYAIVIGYGALLSALADALFCSAPSPIPVSSYLQLTNDGTALARAIADPNSAVARALAVRSKTRGTQTITVRDLVAAAADPVAGAADGLSPALGAPLSVAVIISDPFSVCFEGAHAAAWPAAVVLAVLIGVGVPAVGFWAARAHAQTPTPLYGAPPEPLPAGLRSEVAAALADETVRLSARWFTPAAMALVAVLTLFGALAAREHDVSATAFVMIMAGGALAALIGAAAALRVQPYGGANDWKNAGYASLLILSALSSVVSAMLYLNGLGKVAISSAEATVPLAVALPMLIHIIASWWRSTRQSVILSHYIAECERGGAGGVAGGAIAVSNPMRARGRAAAGDGTRNISQPSGLTAARVTAAASDSRTTSTLSNGLGAARVAPDVLSALAARLANAPLRADVIAALRELAEEGRFGPAGALTARRH